MSRATSRFTVIFPRGTDEEEQAKMRERGSIEVEIHGEDGSRFNATFLTPEKASKNMQRAQEKGHPCLADINLMIVPEITVEAIEASVAYLWNEGFFRHYAMPYRPTPKRILAMMASYILNFRWKVTRM